MAKRFWLPDWMVELIATGAIRITESAATKWGDRILGWIVGFLMGAIGVSIVNKLLGIC